MNKLLKELTKVKEKEYKDVSKNEIIKEANVLLLGSRDKDLDTLQSLGLDHQIKFEKKHTEDFKRTEHAKKVYGNESFTGTQIKKLCNTYNLKILPLDFYNGSIPAELPRVVRDFCESKNVPIGTNNFFILAPVEQFKTIKHVPLSKDPILFYKDPDSSTSSRGYREVKKDDVLVQVINWGSDFSFWRVFHPFFSTFQDQGGDVTKLRMTFVSGILLVLSILASIFLHFFVSVFLVSLACIFLFTNISYSNSQKLWNSPER